MPGSTGTGQPITFKCPKCIRLMGWRDTGRRGFKYEATGKVRPLTSDQRGRGGSRLVHFRVQFICLECGHVGWSRHKDVARELKARFGLSDAAMEGFLQVSREITVAWANCPNGNTGLQCKCVIPDCQGSRRKR